ncbi:5-methylthioribose kinase [Croceifilum oryzae]|uniref:Methylthioribose kinase n=2 Tax=Croceifilum oryzae TaxID=1553429 RepID=A0AAJ1WRQ2_9BACL|nr:S-methyl-5-thioribose kinase [Croceifilum oryzae]MDQ0416830.1 5-methylthioribose kinase [Croceifilum oryzae]
MAQQSVVNQYAPFTTQTVMEFVKTLSIFDHPNKLIVKEIGDGNLNLVFQLVELETNRSIIVKQALPYAKVVGESWPLSLNRAKIESESLRMTARVVPNLVPHVLHTDHELACTVMEDLSDHHILRTELISNQHYPLLAQHIGYYVAQTSFATSDFALHPFVKKELVQKFTNPDLCKITEDLVFTDPFFDHPTNDFPHELRHAVETIWADEDLLTEVGLLKFQFLTHAEALLHGDLHTGSIFVTEQSTKVIDPEFAFFGPIGFDLGQFFANIILNTLSKLATTDRQAIVSDLLRAMEQTWITFAQEFTKLWDESNHEIYTNVPGILPRFLLKVWTDAIGFAGCEIIRRTIGLAHVADLDTIEDFHIQIEIKERALQLGADLIKSRTHLYSLGHFIQRIKGALRS